MKNNGYIDVRKLMIEQAGKTVEIQYIKTISVFFILYHKYYCL